MSHTLKILAKRGPGILRKGSRMKLYIAVSTMGAKLSNAQAMTTLTYHYQIQSSHSSQSNQRSGYVPILDEHHDKDKIDKITTRLRC
jgi:hypothetical protein